MRYIYNPVTDQLDDVETPNLGEKYFASAETDEIIKQINEKHGPGTLFPASDMPVPENPYRDFMERNKRAELPDAFNPDLEQSEPLRPGETLEDWDVSFRRPNAEGGVIGGGQLVQNTDDGSRPGYSGAALAIPLLANPPIAAALGISIAGLGAWAGAQKVQNYIEDNPESLNTPQAQAIMLSLGITPSNLFKKKNLHL